jgi:ribosomal protein S18 acetylase RimI-like enzyme
MGGGAFGDRYSSRSREILIYAFEPMQMRNCLRKIDFSSLNCNIDAIFEDLTASGFVSTSDFPLTLNNDQQPWTWRGDTLVQFSAYYSEEALVGMTISRHLTYNSHLHALWVSPTYQNNGIGRVIMSQFFEESNKNKETNLSFTLHIYKRNFQALDFYTRKCGFKTVEVISRLPSNEGLRQWVTNCRDKNDWPLREGIQLMWRPR